MSKRFGRNQKRAMREALESKTSSLEDMRKQRDNVIANQRPMREALARVARVLGPHFFGLPTVQRMVRIITETYRVDMDHAVSFAAPGDLAAMVQTAVSHLDTVQCKTAVDDLRRQTHIRLSTPTGDMAYAISEEALAQTNVNDWREAFTPLVADAFARMAVGRAK